jgi:hypothetical protein
MINMMLVELKEKLENEFVEINLKDNKLFLFENDKSGYNYIEIINVKGEDKFCLTYNFIRSYGYLFRKDMKKLTKFILNKKQFFQKR